MTLAANLSNLPEDARIKLIGEAASTMIVGVAVEDDHAKIQRYILGVTCGFPGVRHIKTFPGVVRGTVLIQFGPPALN